MRELEEQTHKAECRILQLERELCAERDDYAQLRIRLEASEEEKQSLEVGSFWCVCVYYQTKNQIICGKSVDLQLKL